MFICTVINETLNARVLISDAFIRNRGEKSEDTQRRSSTGERTDNVICKTKLV